MEDVAGTVAAVAGIGLILTKLVDTVRNMFDANGTAPKWVWNVLGLGLGVGAAFVWGLDATGMVSTNDVQAWAGQLLTGLGIGAAASGWHEVLDNISQGATAKAAAALAGPPQATATAVVGDDVEMQTTATDIE